MMAKKHMAVSKKTRFDVFKRDGFICVYCGKSPPEVILEIDHVIPKARAGSNQIDNLVTSCFDCNRGKRDIPLDQIPPSVAVKCDEIREREEQYREYQKLLRSVRNREHREVAKVEDIWTSEYPDYCLTQGFRRSVKSFIEQLGLAETIDSMEIAVNKTRSRGDSLKYFCGVCWRKIERRNDATDTVSQT
jgi:hypothetical protein